MISDITLQTISDAAHWDAACLAHDAHVLQTFGWGELKQRFGWRAERVLWRDGETIHAGAQLLYRSLAPGFTIAYLPRGPFGKPAAPLAPFLAALIQRVRARGAFLLKLEPDWAQNDARVEILRAARAAPTDETIQPPATIQLDLTADLDAILARMKSKWRYNIRLAEKKEISVRIGTRADVPAFYELLRVTGARDHFAIHGLDYYRAAFNALVARDYARLLIAEYETQPLAMLFVTAFGAQAIYLYGASGNAERQRMPNHALHWAAIQWAKARGCATYDLWGIPANSAAQADSENLPTSLYQFKQGFGGTIVRYTGAWDFVFSAPKARLYQFARKLRAQGFG